MISKIVGKVAGLAVRKREYRMDEVREKITDKLIESKDASEVDKYVQMLEKIDSMEKKGKIDGNTKAVIATSLAQTVLILKNEQFHVVTSKALGFIMRGRV